MTVTHNLHTPVTTNGTTLGAVVQLAADMIQHEIYKVRKLAPDFNPDDLWASVDHTGRIRVGTPVLHQGQGYYVDYRGEWEEV